MDLNKLDFRPKSLKEFIGQERVKKELSIYIEAVRKREDVFPHTFFVSAPGLGKTTMAKIIAYELKRDIKLTSGPVLDKPGNVAGLLTSLKEKDILFIDEIHRMPKICQEILYSAMEDFALDIAIGKGHTSKIIRITLPKFTLIGATNKPNLCLKPLLDRFVLFFKLDYYSEEELMQIIGKLCEKLGIEMEKKAARFLARASKGIPRQAVNFVKKIKEFVFLSNASQLENKAPLKIRYEDLKKFFQILEIDDWGLTPEDRRCLFTLYQEFKGGPVGLVSLALSANISPEELETIYEPALIRLGLIARTKQGRVLTQKGYIYLKEKLKNI